MITVTRTYFDEPLVVQANEVIEVVDGTFKVVPLEDRKPRIVCAAVRSDDGELLIGLRHYSSDMHAQIENRMDGGKFKRRHDNDQGFVDQYGQYYTRQEAWTIALSNMQIRYRCGGDESHGGTLYSENLY